MKPKQRFKIGIDVIMTVLFMTLMAYHVTGNRLHEWLGVTLFVLFILHHILNAKWYTGLFKGKYPAGRILMLSINFLLFAAMAGMMVSGIMLSRDVFGFLNLRAGMFGRRLHMVSTAWGYLLMSMHLGLHWGMMMGMVRKKIPMKSKWGGYAVRAIAILLSVYGVYAFVTRQLADRMFLLMEYAFFDYQEPAIFFFADYLSILILFAAIAYYLSKFLRKPKHERSKKV